MRDHVSLQLYLSGWAVANPMRRAVADTRDCHRGGAPPSLAGSPMASLLGDTGRFGRRQRRDGDGQKALDVWANDQLIDALRDAPVAILASEELDEPLPCCEGDGRSPSPSTRSTAPRTSTPTSRSARSSPSCRSLAGRPAFLQPGARQLAAGYRRSTARNARSCSRVGEGTSLFTLDPESRPFRLTGGPHRHSRSVQRIRDQRLELPALERGIRAYIDDCIAGRRRTARRRPQHALDRLHGRRVPPHPGARRRVSSTRPTGARPIESGRLRLVYEANPIAFLIEQAGGKATDGKTPIIGPRAAGDSTSARR